MKTYKNKEGVLEQAFYRHELVKKVGRFSV